MKNNTIYRYVTFMIRELTNCVRVDKSTVQYNNQIHAHIRDGDAVPRYHSVWHGGYEIWGLQNRVTEASSLLGYDTVLVGKWILMFQRITEPSHSWSSSPRRPWNVEKYLPSSTESHPGWLESSFKRYLQNTGRVHKQYHGTVQWTDLSHSTWTSQQKY